MTTVEKDLKVNPQTSSFCISHEVSARYSYVGGANTYNDTGDLGSVGEHSSSFSYVASPATSEKSLLRLGVGWDAFNFGLPTAMRLPNTLQSTNLVVGADFNLSEHWLMRIEAQPGFYSDFQDLSSEDVNVPFIIGGSYLVTKDLQWFFGMQVNLWSDMPVAPGLGVRWKFADQWTLMFLMPKPRIEYDLNEKITFYAGGDILGGTYRVSEDLGVSTGNGNLNSAILSYREIRVGAGARWKVIPQLILEAEAGCMVNREFNYHRADIKLESEQAPYGQISLKSEF